MRVHNPASPLGRNSREKIFALGRKHAPFLHVNRLHREHIVRALLSIDGRMLSVYEVTAQHLVAGKREQDIYTKIGDALAHANARQLSGFWNAVFQLFPEDRIDEHELEAGHHLLVREYLGASKVLEPYKWKDAFWEGANAAQKRDYLR